MAARGQTPSQTVGPYFAMRLGGEGQNILSGSSERIRIEGRVLDGDGKHVEDALVEIWQANPHGRYRHMADQRGEIGLEEGFTGFGRAATDFTSGDYWFETVKPGQVPDLQGRLQAPHLSMIVQARGMLGHLYTRMYFSDEVSANQHDMVLAQVPDGRRQTLIALLDDSGGRHVYRFDVQLQGDAETVFFDF